MDKDCSNIRDIEEVSECPKNEEDTNTAANIKSCTRHTPICCEPNQFHYHCLLSGEGTGYYEFCACTKKISYCAELNLAGQQIQANFHAHCRPGILNSACGRFYYSSRAFEVPSCYEQVSPFMDSFSRPGLNTTDTDSENANDTANLKDNNMSKSSQQDITRPNEEILYTAVSDAITESLNTTTTLGNDNSASIDDEDQFIRQIFIVVFTFVVFVCTVFIAVLIWRKRIDRKSLNTRNGEELSRLEMRE